MKRKFISLLLVLTMVIVVLPFSAIDTYATSDDLIWPCESAYYVTCMYYYKDGTKHSTRYGYEKGMDIAGGGNIVAAESGTVETATDLGNKSFGKYVVIKHSSGYKTLYAHLSSYSVEVGETVNKGQKIGVMGSTGNSSGTHLHFEYSGGDPWKEYYNPKYASNIIFEQNVRSNNNTYNSDKTIVNVIDSNYYKSGSYYYYSGSGQETHTHSYTSVVTAPTCENKGYTTHICSCEDSYVDSYVDALGHNYVGTVSKSATCTEKGTTTYKCSRCAASYTEDDIAALGHDYDDEVITKPTCKEEGLMSHTCSRCADNYTEAIPAKGHNYDNPVWVTTVSATCASEGEQAGYCPDCGDLIKTRSTKALGHEIGKWVVSVQPTCTSAGEEQCYCSRCGEVIDSRAIKALGHDEGTWVVTKKATCIDEGEEVCFCTRCGKAIDERKTDALGHDEGVWKIDFEPTADHDGQMSLYCTRCNCVLESKTFKRHKHVEGYRETVIEPTCTTEGEGGVFCAECGAKFDTYSIPALGHIYSEWYTNKNGTHSKICSRCHDLQIENCHYDAVVTAPTCNDGGYTTYTCADCGHSYISDYVAALGHDWSGWTEDENGQTHSRTCANCGETETEEHNWNDWVYNKDATLCKNGTKTRTCQDCGASETEKSIHTAWLCRIPYTIVLWIGNLLKKALYIVSLDWLLPWLNITPVH